MRQSYNCPHSPITICKCKHSSGLGLVKQKEPSPLFHNATKRTVPFVSPPVLPGGVARAVCGDPFIDYSSVDENRRSVATFYFSSAILSHSGVLCKFRIVLNSFYCILNRSNLYTLFLLPFFYHFSNRSIGILCIIFSKGSLHCCPSDNARKTISTVLRCNSPIPFFAWGGARH